MSTMTTQHIYDWNYFSKLLKKLLIPLFIICIIFNFGCVKKDIEKTNDILCGVFYQPQLRDMKISNTEWNRRLKLLKKAGIKTIYIQWTEYEFCSFEGMKRENIEEDICSFPLAEKVVKYAEKHKLKIVFGLFSDKNYYSEIGTNNNQYLTAYLTELIQRHKKVAQELLEEYGKSSAFAGWYIPEEIDDLNWNKFNKQIILKQHLSKTYDMLMGLTKKKRKPKVFISTFFKAHTLPEVYGKMWLYLTRNIPLTVLIQDTAGIESPIQAQNKILFIKAVANALTDKRNWGVIFEIFEQSGNNFRSVPTKDFLTTNQLKALKIRPAPKHRIAFSLRYLFDNDDRLLKEYMNRRKAK